MKYKRLVLAILVCICLAVTSCSGLRRGATSASGTASAFEVAPCPVKVPEDIVEGGEVTCGYVTVPEEHANLDGPTLRLAVAIVQSTSDSPRPDPLVYGSGGPGGSTLATLPMWLSSRFDTIREERDIVLIEQRGTTYAEPALQCEEIYQAGIDMLTQDLDLTDEQAAMLDAIQTCRDRLTNEGVNLSAYNARENAADFPFVLSALGYDQFNFYGVSYGTVLGQHLMRDHSEHVRSVILDSVVPLDIARRTSVPRATNHAIQLLFEACETNPTCHARYPDVDRVFFDLAAQLDRHPLTLEIDAPDIYFPVEVQVTGRRLVAQLYQHIYHTAAIPLLPAQIYALAEGETDLVDNMGRYILGSSQLSRGMYYSALCSEAEGYLFTYADREELHPTVAAMFPDTDAQLQAACEIWDVERLPPETYTSVASDVPTLILSGEFDPVTPPANGDVVAEALTRAYVYTVPATGHSVFGRNECVMDLLQAFLDTPTQAPDATCLNQMGIEFVAGLSLSDLTLAPIHIPEYNIHALAPEGWFKADTDYFIAPEGNVELVITDNQDETLESLLEKWNGSEVLREITSNGHTWAIRGIAKPEHGAAGHLATTPSEEGVYMVLAISSLDKKGDLYTYIFKPIVEAFEVR